MLAVLLVFGSCILEKCKNQKCVVKITTGEFVFSSLFFAFVNTFTYFSAYRPYLEPGNQHEQSLSAAAATEVRLQLVVEVQRHAIHPANR